MTNCIVIVENDSPRFFASMNQLIDAEETMVRAYLAHKDELAKRKATIEKMEAERDSLIARANAIQKDLDGMIKPIGQ